VQRHKLSRPMVSMVSKEESFLFGATVLGMGLYFWLKGGNRMSYGIPLMIFGFVAAAYSAFAYHKPQLPRIPIGIGMLFVAWIGFSYDVYYRYNSNGSREVSYPPPPQSLNNTDNSQLRWASKQIPSENEKEQGFKQNLLVRLIRSYLMVLALV
jgi:hypothetical protein